MQTTGLNILIVEDNKDRIEAFKRRLIGNNIIVVKQSRDGISRLRAKDIDVLFLDHDLAGTGEPEPSGPRTGYEVAKWLEENPKFQPRQIIVHSLNAAGRKNILAALPNAIELPFAWEKI
jgi:CheY-like chemotaxis protein